MAYDKKSVKHVSLKMTGQDGSVMCLRLTLRDQDLSETGGCVRVDPRLESQKVKNEIIAERKRKFDCGRAEPTLEFRIKKLAEILNKKKLESANCERKSDDHINLKAIGQDGSVLYFKINKRTALRKLMNAYCGRKDMKTESTYFFFNGQQITESDTPAQLEMKDNDNIHVLQQLVD